MFLNKLQQKHEQNSVNLSKFKHYLNTLELLNKGSQDEYILSKDGQVLTLGEYQKDKKLPHDKVAQYFSLSERHLNQPFILAEPILIIADALRAKRGKPVIINSAFRSEAKQLKLKEQGYKTATFSPHCLGLAVDFGCSSKEEVMQTVDFLQDISKKTGFGIRLGFTQYLKLGQIFVHCDCAPHYFGNGKIFESFLFNDIKAFGLTINW